MKAGLYSRATRLLVTVALMLGFMSAIGPISAQASGSCSSSSTVSMQSRTISVGGVSRSFFVSTPNPAPAVGTPVPVIFNFHGAGGNASAFETSTGMAATATQRGYTVITPQAIAQGGGSTPGWGSPSSGGAPADVAFAEAILTDIDDVTCVDDSRIFASGFSSGASFSAYLGCRWNKVAAIAPWAGVNLINPARCTTRAVPLLVTHGDADTTANYFGPFVPDPNLAESSSYIGTVTRDVDYWGTQRNGCSSYTDSTPVAGVTKRTFTSCTAATVLYTVAGGGHVVFTTPISSVNLSLDFFDNQTKIAGPDYVAPPSPAFNTPSALTINQPGISVSPAGPYTGGQNVTVSVTGFSPNASVVIALCKRGKTVSSPNSCTLTSGSAYLVSSNSSGSASSPLTVLNGSLNNPDGDTCGPSNNCVFIALNISRQCEVTATGITYVGGPTQGPVSYPGCPRIFADPGVAASGETVTVRGSVFPANTTIRLEGRFVWPPTGAPSGATVTTTTDSTGAFSVSYVAPGFATGIGAFNDSSNVLLAQTPFLAQESPDRCISYTADSTGGPGCLTGQKVQVSVLQGVLTQRTYVTATPTVGSTDQSSVLSPVRGTTNVNTSPTTINLGTITSPLAPTAIIGNLNDITVSDSRGGTFGWSLTASLTNFAGATGKAINKSTLSVTPSCVPATNSTAWDYTAGTKTSLTGFDSSLVASGQTAGATQGFSTVVSLCTKDTTVNETTQTTGGVFNITAPLTLTIPAFQAADVYVAIMTITLS